MFLDKQAKQKVSVSLSRTSLKNSFVAMIKNTLFAVILCYTSVSWAQKTIPNKAEMCATLSEMIQNDRLHRSKKPDKFSGAEKSIYSEKQIDSMNVLQWKIDNYNTEKLIALTKEYGWISDERIDCPQLQIWLIFRHSQKKYFKEILELIEKERAAKRLNDFQYGLIHDHLHGRPRG